MSPLHLPCIRSTHADRFDERINGEEELMRLVAEKKAAKAAAAAAAAAAQKSR